MKINYNIFVEYLTMLNLNLMSINDHQDSNFTSRLYSDAVGEESIRAENTYEVHSNANSDDNSYN